MSDTLLLVGINEIFSVISYPTKPILFADDLSIHLQTTNPQHGHRVLQKTINRILKWLFNHAFRISHPKTNVIIFEKRKSKTPFPPHLLDNHLIPIFETVKVGVRFHTCHSWLPHIEELKIKGKRATNILKYLTHPPTDCNRKTLLPLYQSLIRSILDYAAPVYGLAPPPQLALLDTIQNSAIRLCTGAFRTSLALSLSADARIPPLHYRRLTLSAGLLFSIAQLPSTPIHDFPFNKT